MPMSADFLPHSPGRRLQTELRLSASASDFSVRVQIAVVRIIVIILPDSLGNRQGRWPGNRRGIRFRLDLGIRHHCCRAQARTLVSVLRSPHLKVESAENRYQYGQEFAYYSIVWICPGICHLFGNGYNQFRSKHTVIAINHYIPCS